ncbi:hypothetical protein H5410_060806 [Solanum commersonii]|uniref:Uncharacterized protein n=1 Tax=Solanum commersonii TaxID=4109 RepID=A0A9J5W771_SOLCO|nr:hypothetical protein H5410_060806 [Solanum commersonii]
MWIQSRKQEHKCNKVAQKIGSSRRGERIDRTRPEKQGGLRGLGAFSARFGWSPADKQFTEITLPRRSWLLAELCLLFTPTPEPKENRERGSPLTAELVLASRRSLRLPDRKRRPVAGWFPGCSLTGAGRSFA